MYISMKPSQSAFTLIELLIVVAIIGILAAIAVPNFLNAQIRAKVANMQATHKTLHTAMMMYYGDFNTFHAHSHKPTQHNPLTSPIAYLTMWPLDIFQKGLEDNKTAIYFKRTVHWEPHAGYTDSNVTISLVEKYPGLVGFNVSFGPSLSSGGVYDPSNGLRSAGGICSDVAGSPHGDYRFPPGNF